MAHIGWKVLASLAWGGLAAFCAADRWFGPSVGLYVPSNAGIRKALGSQWYEFGIGPADLSLREGWRVGSDLSMVRRHGNNNKFWMVLPSIGTTYTAVNRGTDVQPFISFRGGPAYFDYSIDKAGTRVSTKRVGLNANVEAGIVVSERLRISVRYNVVSKFDGFNFDGTAFLVSYKLFRW